MKRDLKSRLFLSTIGSDSRALALQHGLGLEMADFCTAWNLDVDLEQNEKAARDAMAGLDRFWFHAPFAELCPAAIDPKVRAVTMERYRQALAVALGFGIRRLVIHSGFIPLVYFPQWFVEQSVIFWREFLRDAPKDITIALENVMEPGPEMPVEIARQVNDCRFGLCLDLGHANTRISETPPSDWIKPMTPWLRHVHLHNNLGDMDLHSDLGTGSVPMQEALDRLLELPHLTFTIENQLCAPSLSWLMERGYLKKREEALS